MASFYDPQLDYLKKSTLHFLSPALRVFREEAFLYFLQGRAFHFRKGEEFPEKGFPEELQESFRRRKAIGIIFRIQTQIKAPWPLPDSEEVDDSLREAALIVLVHPQARLLTAAADIKEVVPHLERQVKDQEGNPIEDQAWTPEGPNLSGWIEVGISKVPNEYRSLDLMR
jgi:hypothetical protein